MGSVVRLYWKAYMAGWVPKHDVPRVKLYAPPICDIVIWPAVAR